MNRIYRVIFNPHTGAYQAVSEIARSKTKTSADAVVGDFAAGYTHASPSLFYRAFQPLALVVALGGVFASSAYAAPTGGEVVAGAANIAQAGNITDIHQASQNAAINWQDFNIKAHETVNFHQPNSQAITLNRVLGNEKSVIDGMMNANGKVFIQNPNGTLIGKDAQINVGALVATSAHISDEDFMNGQYRFTDAGTGSVENQGKITVPAGGVVALIAPVVKNSGSIHAHDAHTLLASADSFSITLPNHGGLSYTLDKGTLQGLVDNGGAILANGGRVVLTSLGVDAVKKSVIRHSGIIEANNIVNNNGTIELLGDLDHSRLDLSGSLKAEGQGAQDGGFIETSAAKLNIQDSAYVSTDAKAGKTGTWLIDPKDFTVAASGGDMTGTKVAEGLQTNNVYLNSRSGAKDGKGDVIINDEIKWNKNTLILTADNDIHINATLSASGSAKLALEYGQGTRYGGGSNYYLKKDTPLAQRTVKINLPAGKTFSIKKGSDGSTEVYDVIHQMPEITKNADGDWVSAFTTDKIAFGRDIDVGYTKNYEGFAGWELPWTRSGNYRFPSAAIHGLGHTVDGLWLRSKKDNQNTGLFQNNGNYINGKNLIRINGKNLIRDISVTNVDVHSQGSFANTGGLVGTSGNIYNSYATGSVFTTGEGARTGGLVGDGYTIYNSYATGNVSTTGKNADAGGLVGYGYTIYNSYATGNVSTTGKNADAGGLLGSGYTIYNSYATGNVFTEDAKAGGLVGDGYTIYNSYATGNVSTTGKNADAGGLAGYGGYIHNSYATGSISTIGKSARAGGLVGDGHDISNSYATGNVSTIGFQSNAGGLVGDGHDISNSYATGKVFTAGHAVNTGGLVGGGRNIHNSYATGGVSATGSSAYAGGLVGGGRNIHNSYANNIVSATGVHGVQGGILGRMTSFNGVLSNSFFNQDKNLGLATVGQLSINADVINSSGKKDADLKDKATFTDWDFDTIWRIKEDGSEYPYLRALTQGTITIDPIDPSEPKGDLGVQAHALNKTYDAKAVATVDDLRAIAQANGYKDIVSITGLKDGDSLDSLGKLSYGGTWQNAKNAGKYSIIPTGLNGGQKYEIQYGEGSLTINKRPLTITANKEYDGTVSAKVYGDDDVINVPQIISLNNKILGDDVYILAGTSGVLSHKNHGWSNLVDLGNLALTGKDSNNYVLTKEGSGWEISKKRVRLTGERQYDGSAWVNGGDLVIDNRDIINGDELILNRYSGDVKVDGYTVNSSNKPRKIVSTEKIKLDGKDSGNYIIDKNRSYINIIPRYISVDVSKEYDGSNIFTKGFKIGNIVDGDKVDAYISRATVSGKDNISDGIDYDKFTSISIGINNPNYKFDMDNSRVSAIITPKIVEIIPLGDFEKYYYQNMNKFNFNHEEIVSGDKVTGYLIPYINKDGTSVIGDDIKYIDVGKYDMNFSLSKILVDNSKNYTLFIKPKKFEVKPLPLTVKANDQEYRPKWYNPAQGVTALAFFNSKDYQIIIPNNGLEYPREIEHYGELGILNGRDLQLVTPKPGDYQILPSQNFKFPNYDVNFKKGVYRVYASEYIPVVSHIRGLAYVVEGAGMQVGEEALGKVESTVGAITTYAQNIYDNFDWDNHPYASVALVVVGGLAIVGEGASHLLSSAPDMVVLMVKGVGVFAIEESESWTDDEKGEYANHFRDVVDVLKIFWDIKEMKEMVGSDLSSGRLKKELYDSLVANKGFTGVEARQYVKYLDDKGIIDAMLSDAAGEIFWNATSLTRDAIQFIVNSTGKPVEKINNRGSYDK